MPGGCLGHLPWFAIPGDSHHPHHHPHHHQHHHNPFHYTTTIDTTAVGGAKLQPMLLPSPAAPPQSSQSTLHSSPFKHQQHLSPSSHRSHHHHHHHGIPEGLVAPTPLFLSHSPHPGPSPMMAFPSPQDKLWLQAATTNMNIINAANMSNSHVNNTSNSDSSSNIINNSSVLSLGASRLNGSDLNDNNMGSLPSFCPAKYSTLVHSEIPRSSPLPPIIGSVSTTTGNNSSQYNLSNSNNSSHISSITSSCGISSSVTSSINTSNVNSINSSAICSTNNNNTANIMSNINSNIINNRHYSGSNSLSLSLSSSGSNSVSSNFLSTFSGSLLSRATIGDGVTFPFTTMPTLLPFAPSWDIFQETTARLLFMMVRWVRSLGPFQTLSRQDQCVLVEASWKELFLVHLAQWYLPVDLAPLLTSPAASLRVPQDARTSAEVATIQDVLRRFRHLSPDTTECGCLKAVLLFKPEANKLLDIHPVEMLQDQAQCILSDYIRTRLPRQPTRFGRLLLLLPGLKTVRASTVETLFFRDTVGEAPVHRLVLDMYTMDKVE